MEGLLSILIQPNSMMRWIAGLVAIGCLLVIFAIQMTVFGHVTNLSAGFELAEDPLKDSGVTVLNNTIDDGGDYLPYYLAYAQQDQLSDERTVHIKILKQPSEVLESGEDMPDQDFMDLYLNSRAHFVAQAECELLKRTFVSECAVSYASARKYKEVAEFSASLKFVAKKRSEIPAAGTNWRFEAPTTKLNQNSKPVAWTATQTARLKVYRTIGRNCDKLRKKVGDCAILSVSISEDLDHKTDRPVLRAKAVHGYLEQED